MSIIRTVNLTKKFRDLVAVADVSLEIEEGECFGLLGPNGAGKTSLIRMITAVSPPSSGGIWAAGRDVARYPRQTKSILGVVPQIDNLDTDLNVLQNLLTFARYFDIPRAEALRRSMEVLTLFRLEERWDSKVKELSGGMRRCLLLARGLINQPRILMLDEPSIGLDPLFKHMVWHKLRDLKEQGVTQLLCTHNMEEAAALCDRLAIMHLGRVLVVDAPRRLVSRYIGEMVAVIEPAPEERESLITELNERGLEFDQEDGSAIKVFHLEDDSLARRFPGRARPGTLEDVFFKLTGRSLAE